MANPTVDTHPQTSVRELIFELARVEDAVRALPTYVRDADGVAVVNPELLELLDRERAVVSALRTIELRGLELQDGTADEGP